MKTDWKKLVILLLVLLPIAAAEYEENVREGIFLIRPHNSYIPDTVTPTYLSDENLAFYACIEYDDTPVRLSVLCNDDNNFVDIPATKWGPENCYLGAMDLSSFTCSNAQIVADYNHEGENLRVTKNIRIDTVTGSLQRILDTQYKDGGWSSPLDTAFTLHSLHPFADVFNDTIDQGLSYLKNSRDDADKCWPQGQCQVSTTAMIASLLNSAGYEDTLRIIHDATIYLEKSMSYITSGETWLVSLEDFAANQNNSVNTSCVFGYDNANTTYNLSKYGTALVLNITPAYNSIVRVVCTENIYVDINSSVRGSILHYEGDNLSYSIPGPCWTFNNDNVTCDMRTTAFALGSPLDADRKTAAEEYLHGRLVTDITGTHTADGDIMNTALILSNGNTTLSSDDVAGMVKYLLYTQSNLGGWNSTQDYYNYSFYEAQDAEVNVSSHVLADNVTKNIVYTGFAVEALLRQGYTSDSEPIQDAERWMSLNEKEVSDQLTDTELTDAAIVASYNTNVSDIVNDPKRNSMELAVLSHHARPFIKTTPAIITLDKANLSIDMINPTTFNLDNLVYSVSADVSPYMSVEQKAYLAQYSFRHLLLSQTSSQASNAFGTLRIGVGSDEFARIPVLISSYPTLSITIPQQLTVFGPSAILAMNVTKSSHNFSCTMTWKDGGITSTTDFNLEQAGAFNMPVQFTQAATEEKDYHGELSCSALSSTFTFPFTVAVSRFLTKPLAVSPSVLTVDSADQQLSISLTNLLDESIDVSLGLRDPASYLEFSDQYVNLYPGETKNVTLFVSVPKGDNVSSANAVVIKTFNIEERIPLQVDVTYTAPTTMPVWMIAGIIIFAVGLVVVLGYYGYSNRKKLYELYSKRFKKQTQRKKMLEDVQSFEKKEETVAIKNMVSILKMQGVADKDVRTRLKAEGFSDTDIDEALKAKLEEEKAPPVAVAKK